MMQGYPDHQWLGPLRVAKRLEASNGSISDELLIRALQPLSLLQIGLQQQLLRGCRDQVVVRRVRALEQAMDFLAEEKFDAIILGPNLADAWPISAYARLAEAAGSIPVVVKADPVEPMTLVKQRQHRANDMVVSSAVPTRALERIILAAVLRHRALAALAHNSADQEQPGSMLYLQQWGRW